METKNCQNCKNDFTIEPDDFSFYSKINVPPPTWCPQCRLVRRLNWQGVKHLYKNKCEKTSELLITTHSPDSLYKIYRQDIWWGDSWDPKDYGREYDFSQPFFQQLKELFVDVPLPALYTDYSTMVNSDYCNAASSCKNCYLAFRSTGAEDSAYISTVVDIKGSFDVSFSNHSELCYEILRVNKSYKAFYSQHCEDCFEIYFCSDLVGCSNCFGCINLVNKKYCIFNEQYSKEEYLNKIKEFDWSTVEGVEKCKQQALDSILKCPRKNMRGKNNSNVSGDYIFNSKNTLDSYMVGNGEDCRYCQFTKEGPISSSYDYSFFGDGAERIYESCWVGLNAYNNKFCAWNYYASDIEYSFGCHSSRNVFGCSGIRKGEYCILNKQYSKKDYEELIPKIKKHMQDMPYIDHFGRIYSYGEMLPPEFSPWAYNESTANDVLPSNQKEVEKQGMFWRVTDTKEYQNASIEIPKHSIDAPDDFVKEILKCNTCEKNYRLIPIELQFYKRFNIPIPRECFFCRDKKRTNLLNPIKIYNRICDKCKKEIQSSYSPDQPEIIYCEKCYQQEVV